MSDLISRQAAIDALGEAPEVWTDSPEEFAALNQWEMDVAAIKAVPSVQRNGHWEIYVISPFDGEGCRCSECGTEGAPYWDFCPNCGADMRGW